MSHFLVFLLILVQAFLVLATANESAPTVVKPNVQSLSNPPFPSPPIRKLGKHNQKAVKSSFAPSLSPSIAPQSVHYSTEEVSSSDQQGENFQGQQVHIEKQHHSIDRSVAGGGVILGGLATTFLVAVFCYIRATGRKSADPNA